MSPTKFATYLLGVLALMGCSFLFRWAVDGELYTPAFHVFHAGFALAIAVVFEALARRLTGVSSTVWIRGNPVAPIFWFNFAVWLVSIIALLYTYRPTSGTFGQLEYLAGFYLGATVLVALLAPITRGEEVMNIEGTRMMEPTRCN